MILSSSVFSLVKREIIIICLLNWPIKYFTNVRQCCYVKMSLNKLSLMALLSSINIFSFSNLSLSEHFYLPYSFTWQALIANRIIVKSFKPFRTLSFNFFVLSRIYDLYVALIKTTIFCSFVFSFHIQM